jgi:hypothetical protein
MHYIELIMKKNGTRNSGPMTAEERLPLVRWARLATPGRLLKASNRVWHCSRAENQWAGTSTAALLSLNQSRPSTNTSAAFRAIRDSHRAKRYTKSHCYSRSSLKTKQSNSVAFSPQANYIDRTTAAGRRNLVPTFAARGVSRGQRRGPPRPLFSVF